MGEFIWQPTEAMKKEANITRFMEKHGISGYQELIRKSQQEVEWFWDAAVKDLDILWNQPYTQVLDTSEGIPWSKWFVGGKLNIVSGCLDRHASSWRRNKAALIWECEDGSTFTLTYAQLKKQVDSLAAAMKAAGVGKGDTVGMYMPMTPEMVALFYATLKIGAILIPIFSGFGATAVAARLEDAKSKIMFTADGSVRRGKNVPLKVEADRAVALAPCVEKMVVLKRTGQQVEWKEGRDVWWHDFIATGDSSCPTEEMNSEDPALIIYTSGTTGRPKGTVHTHAGCLAQMTKEICYSFDLKEDDTFFWVSDIGWMMGPWELIGVMNFGGTVVIYEGAPNYPAPDRLWKVIERQGVTILGLSPTVVRLLMREGTQWVGKCDLSTLRILGSTGEPWDDDSYKWFFEHVGGGRCPIINISGGTEIVGCFLIPLPIIPLKPCTLGGPGLGMDIDVFDDEGNSLIDEIGYLVCKKPAPSMTKGLWGDPERYLETYWSRFKDVWYHGDWAKVDQDGYWFLYGRADDTMKVSGRRTGPGEIESALIDHPAVSEAAAIGIPHEIKGEGVVCFVVLKPAFTESEDLREELKGQVVKFMGKALKPEDVRFVSELPKTRSGKIVRRAIKAVHLGKDPGDLSSLENPQGIEEIKNSR